MNMAQEFGYKKALGISTIPRAKFGSGRRIRITKKPVKVVIPCKFLSFSAANQAETRLAVRGHK